MPKPALTKLDALGKIRSGYKKKDPSEKAQDRILISEYDHIVFICVFVLLLFGIIMVLSSSYYSALRDPKIDSMYYYFIKQSTAAIIGFLVMVIAATINYHAIRILILPAYAAANALLVMVKLYGEEINGAKRWLNIFGISFQPSEFAKAAVILLLAFYISGGKDRTKTLSGLLGCALIIGIPCGLVFWGNNLSTAIIIVAIGFGMIFVTSPYAKILIAIGIAGIGAMAVYLTFLSDSFRGGRVTAWLDPWSDPLGKGFQIIQSLYAVASGGLFGLGLGQSKQKLKYMPEPQNDFIFAVICEELGFFGAAVILLLFSILIWRGVRIALNAIDLLGCLLATGIVTMIGVQVIINVSVVTNTIPNTGIPLPFISFGGTSLIFIMALMGVLLNISRYTKISS